MSYQEPNKPLDLLAIGAHPDDVELFAGGTLALLASRGRRIGILHLTRGECGTRGTAEIREAESVAAADILKVAARITLDLGDGRLESSPPAREAVVKVLRDMRPTVVMTHGLESRHPDHSRAHELVRDACFLANVGGYAADAGARHAVQEIIFYVGHEMRESLSPDWIVDTSSVHETKLAAMRAYATQFYAPGAQDQGPKTLLSSPEFWEDQENRARRWGRMIHTRHGEPFTFQHPPHAAHAFIKMLLD